MNKQDEIPVATYGKEPVIYTIPAKPKKKPPWWYRNADGLLLIWGCVVLMIYLWIYP